MSVALRLLSLALAENGSCLPLSFAWSVAVAQVREAARAWPGPLCLFTLHSRTPSLQDQLFIIAYLRPLPP